MSVSVNMTFVGRIPIFLIERRKISCLVKMGIFFVSYGDIYQQIYFFIPFLISFVVNDIILRKVKL